MPPSFPSSLRQGVRTLADLALPPRCPACGDEEVDSDNFCLGCWQMLDLLGPPQCALCGMKLVAEHDCEAMTCGACLASPPAHDGIYSAMAYGDLAGDMAMKLKYSRKIGLARQMAKLMQRALPDASHLPDPLIVPVPLHRTRIWKRGFNQAALIGRELSRVTGHEMIPDALIRTKRTKPLKNMNAKARRTELKGAIAVSPRYAGHIIARNILLVDDVLTSGATTDAAVSVLKKAGAAKVAIATFARVIDR